MLLRPLARWRALLCAFNPPEQKRSTWTSCLIARLQAMVPMGRVRFMRATINVFFENYVKYAANFQVRIKERRNGNNKRMKGKGKKLRESEVLAVGRETSACHTLHPSRLECRLENASGLSAGKGTLLTSRVLPGHGETRGTSRAYVRCPGTCGESWKIGIQIKFTNQTNKMLLGFSHIFDDNKNFPKRFISVNISFHCIVCLKSWITKNGS